MCQTVSSPNAFSLESQAGLTFTLFLVFRTYQDSTELEVRRRSY